MTRSVILLIDDEHMILESLKGQLRVHFGARFQYETAESAAEAWEVLAELEQAGSDVVVIVSDWLMPGKRGDEVLAEVRAHAPRIGRILLTGQADTDALRRAWSDAQVSDVIHKPWAGTALQQAIETALQGR